MSIAPLVLVAIMALNAAVVVISVARVAVLNRRARQRRNGEHDPY